MKSPQLNLAKEQECFLTSSGGALLSVLQASTKDRYFVPGLGTNEIKSSTESKLRRISGFLLPPTLVGGGETRHQLQARGSSDLKNRAPQL